MKQFKSWVYIPFTLCFCSKLVYDAYKSAYTPTAKKAAVKDAAYSFSLVKELAVAPFKKSDEVEK